MDIPWDFKDKALVDLIHGRQGQVLEIKQVPSSRQGPKKAFKIRYVPPTGLLSSPGRYAKLQMGLDISEWTEKIPEHGWFERPNRSNKPGTPEIDVVIMENEHGESPLRDALNDEYEKSIAEADARAGEKESQQLLERAKNLGNQASNRVADSSEEPRRRKRRKKSSKDDDDDNDSSKKSGHGSGRGGRR